MVLLICGCTSKEMKEYNSLVDELKNISTTKEEDTLSIKVEVEKLSSDLYNYRALIDKPDYEITDVVAILITEEEDTYPSIGIFEEKISLNKDSKEKGIKLSGYIKEKTNDFKLYVSYKKEGKLIKNYYIVDNVTYIEND